MTGAALAAAAADGGPAHAPSAGGPAPPKPALGAPWPPLGPLGPLPPHGHPPPYAVPPPPPPVAVKLLPFCCGICGGICAGGWCGGGICCGGICCGGICCGGICGGGGCCDCVVCGGGRGSGCCGWFGLSDCRGAIRAAGCAALACGGLAGGSLGMGSKRAKSSACVRPGACAQRICSDASTLWHCRRLASVSAGCGSCWPAGSCLKPWLRAASWLDESHRRHSSRLFLLCDRCPAGCEAGCGGGATDIGSMLAAVQSGRCRSVGTRPMARARRTSTPTLASAGGAVSNW